MTNEQKLRHDGDRDEQIAEIRAATASADVIEACDAAIEGDAKARCTAVVMGTTAT